MKILYLHQYFNTPQDSGGTRSYEMARRLVANGHRVELITSYRNVLEGGMGSWFETEECGIHVHWLPVPYSNAMTYRERILAFFKFAFGAARKTSELQADVIFATSTPLTIALPAVYAARRKRIPMVFEVRDLWPELPIAIGALRGRIFIGAALLLERWTYRNSARIVALSPGMKTGIVSKGYLEEKVHLIPNSADLELFDVSNEVGQQFRQRFKWLGTRPLVVYTGTIGKINGVDYLVRLAVEVRESFPDVCFLVVGDGAERAKVRQMAQEWGVLGQNFFMLESLTKAEMPMVLSAADIATSLFIDLPEMWANSANKFFDALASGTPVAINYRGWQAELLKETNAGFVLDARDISIAASQLVQALRDKQWIKKAGMAARILAEERFSRDKLAKELELVLLSAIK